MQCYWGAIKEQKQANERNLLRSSNSILSTHLCAPYSCSIVITSVELMCGAPVPLLVPYLLLALSPFAVPLLLLMVPLGFRPATTLMEAAPLWPCPLVEGVIAEGAMVVQYSRFNSVVCCDFPGRTRFRFNGGGKEERKEKSSDFWVRQSGASTRHRLRPGRHGPAKFRPSNATHENEMSKIGLGIFCRYDVGD